MPVYRIKKGGIPDYSSIPPFVCVKYGNFLQIYLPSAVFCVTTFDLS